MAYSAIGFPRCILYRSAWPAFMDTFEEELPWTTPSTFTIKLLQHEGSLANFYRVDPWHNMNLGVGKSWCASALHIIVETFVEGAITNRLEQLTAAYLEFCRTSESLRVKYSTFLVVQ